MDSNQKVALRQLARFFKYFPKTILKKRIEGKDNEITINKSAFLSQCSIKIRGNNNCIIIEDNCILYKANFYIEGNNNIIKLCNNVLTAESADFYIEGEKCAIIVGSGTTFQQTELAATESCRKIIIGEDCMFSYDIDVRTGDSHSIIDAHTGKRLNHAMDVIIGNHVWVGARCSILKGASISDNSIIATRSIVTKAFTQSGIAIGGIPGRVIRDGIGWKRERLDH